jgi:hypothetical protein
MPALASGPRQIGSGNPVDQKRSRDEIEVATFHFAAADFAVSATID